MLKEIGFDEEHISYIIRTLTGIAIRSTYYVFANKGKNRKIQISYSSNYVICLVTFIIFTNVFIVFIFTSITTVSTNCKLLKDIEVYGFM